MKGQSIPSEKDSTAEVDLEVTVTVGPANLKRLSEDDQAAINRHEDREVTDREVDLETGTWRNRANIAASTDGTEDGSNV